MGLQGNVVEGRLRCPVDGVWKVSVCHLAEATGRGSESNELGFLGCQEKWTHSLEEHYDAKYVDFEMLQQIGDLDLMNLWKDLGDARARNDDIQSSDALALDLLNSRSRVGLGDTVNFDNDQRASFASGECFQRSCCAGVSYSTNDNVIRSRKEDLGEAEAETYSTRQGIDSRLLEICSPRLAPVMRTVVFEAMIATIAS